MAGLRPPRPTDPGVAGAVPYPLRLRAVPAVWGDGPSDYVLARARWQTAAQQWRESAEAAGVVNTYSLFPAHGSRFNWAHEVSPEAVERMLWSIKLSEQDLPTLAREARRRWPRLFDRDWSPGSLGGREHAVRLANLAP